jgi:hypothetical protein
VVVLAKLILDQPDSNICDAPEVNVACNCCKEPTVELTPGKDEVVLVATAIADNPDEGLNCTLPPTSQSPGVKDNPAMANTTPVDNPTALAIDTARSSPTSPAAALLFVLVPTIGIAPRAAKAVTAVADPVPPRATGTGAPRLITPDEVIVPPVKPVPAVILVTVPVPPAGAS